MTIEKIARWMSILMVLALVVGLVLATLHQPPPDPFMRNPCLIQVKSSYESCVHATQTAAALPTPTPPWWQFWNH